MEKPRSALAAVLLGLLAPGLGQLYCVRPKWSAVFFLAPYLGWVAFLVSFGLAGSSLAPALAVFAACGSLGWLGGVLHAGLTARRQRRPVRLGWYNTASVYLLFWLGGLVLPNWGLVRLVRARLLTTVVLAADSMRPTLLPGDALLLDLRAPAREQPARGRLLAFRVPGDDETLRVARLVGLPGERVELTPQGLVIAGRLYEFTEGQPRSYPARDASGGWQEQFVVEARVELAGGWNVFLDPQPAKRRQASWTLGPQQVLLLGDNLYSARALLPGPVPRQALVGRAFMVRFSRDPQTHRWRRERRRLPLP